MKKTLTLSGLGFVAYRFFYSRIESGNAPLLESLNGRVLGIFLISLGIFGLFQATIQHIRNYTELKIQHDKVGYSVALVQSVILLIFFIFVIAVNFKILGYLYYLHYEYVLLKNILDQRIAIGFRNKL